MTTIVPAALTIAGSDCSSGAGIQADLKTFQHFHVHGLTAVTCVVSETARIVRAVHPVPVSIIRDQISLLLDSFPIIATKTGMLFSSEIVRMVVEIFQNHPEIHLVVDPVMIATSGASLIKPEAVEIYKTRLFPLARVITPNLPEAEALLGEHIADEAAMESAVRRLSATFGTAVLLKGGHLQTPDCVDLLVDKGELYRFTAARIPVYASHGTGCSLSAAITAALAQGESLPSAVETAKHYLGEILRQSYDFTSPDGSTIHALNQGTYGTLARCPREAAVFLNK